MLGEKSCSFTWPDKFLSYMSCAVMPLLEMSLTFSYISCVKFAIYILPLIPLLHFYHHWNCLLKILLQFCHKQ